jgi:hypothetical protein
MTQANLVSNGTILVLADVTLVHDGATFMYGKAILVPSDVTLLHAGATFVHGNAI